MYPTISHLIYDLFGVNIPLPIQTFGFWVAMAFISAAWVVSSELKRKESEGFLSASKVKQIIGQRLSIQEILSTLLIGFGIGFKALEAIFHYNELVANPQSFILSTRGNALGGILMACLLYTSPSPRDRTRSRMPSSA